MISALSFVSHTVVRQHKAHSRHITAWRVVRDRKVLVAVDRDAAPAGSFLDIRALPQAHTTGSRGSVSGRSTSVRSSFRTDQVSSQYLCFLRVGRLDIHDI